MLDVYLRFVQEQSGSADVAIRQREQGFVGECRADERNSEGEAVRTEAFGSRNSCEIHQVHKICVVTEIRVQLHRIRSDLLVGVYRSGRRQ